MAPLRNLAKNGSMVENDLNVDFSPLNFPIGASLNTGGSREFHYCEFHYCGFSKLWLMRFYGLFILLLRTENKDFANAIFG